MKGLLNSESGVRREPDRSARRGASGGEPQIGELRIWWVPQVPMTAFHYPVQSLEQAARMLHLLALYDLFQLEHRVKPDFCNVGGLEVFQDGEWSDWYDEETGDEIREYAAQMGWIDD